MSGQEIKYSSAVLYLKVSCGVRCCLQSPNSVGQRKVKLAKIGAPFP